MPGFIIIALVGLMAQLIDGSLGMAYGASCATLLLAVGVAPALASTSIHFAELGTTLVSGASHWRFGNVDRGNLLWMALPGGLGAFAGALALTSISTETAAPIIAAFLFCLGAYILGRFAFRTNGAPVSNRRVSPGLLLPLCLTAGFMDALGGGGWGPIATPTLLASGRMEPRKIVGTVDTSEFVVALGASAGFLLGLNAAAVPWSLVGALLVGGVIAAPIAAWLVRLLPARVMGTAVGGVILLTNARTMLRAVLPQFDLAPHLASIAYVVIAVVWVAALLHAVVVVRREQLQLQSESASN